VWLVITTHADDNRGDLFINKDESAQLEHVRYFIFAVTTVAHANNSVVLSKRGDRADEGLLVHEKHHLLHALLRGHADIRSNSR
jgi:hypothetical protein